MVKHYFSYLNDTVRNKWEQPALIDLDGSTSYTYKTMATQIACLQEQFNAIGICKGDKIALAGRNCSNWAVSFLAIASYKAVAVCILPDFTGEDIQKLVEHSEAKLLLVGPAVKKKIKPEQMPNLLGVVFMDDFSMYYSANPDIMGIYNKAGIEFSYKYRNGISKSCINYPTDNYDDLAILNYTSGTTSSPKGVMLSHGNICNNVDFGIRKIPHREGDKVLSMLPIAHMFGLMFEFLYHICDGAQIYFLTTAPTPTVLMKSLAQVRPFMILTVPLVIEKIIRKKVFPTINKPFVKMLWNIPGVGNAIRKIVKKELLNAFGGNLRYLIIGGAALNEEVELCLKQIHIPYSIGYGMTECAPLIAYEDWNRYVFRSCGKVVDGMQMRVDFSDKSSSYGEIQVKGNNVMMGYYKNQQATADVFTEDGWMRTGDLGYVDRRGNVFLRGRCKNMLLGANGQNIYPEEIEDKLNSLPLVLESVVVEREGRLVALVYPDYETANKILQVKDIKGFMEKNRMRLNKHLPMYSQISSFELVEKEFEKTPKRSIKRFMYR